MTLFFLVLTFWATYGSAGVVLPAVVVPGSYATQDACESAGSAARANYNGGAKIEWTCVPSDTK